MSNYLLQRRQAKLGIVTKEVVKEMVKPVKKKAKKKKK
jgi:hypothetical protein